MAVVNKRTIAKSFTAQLDTPAEISGYSGAIAAASGRAFLTSVDATQASVTNATASLSTSVATATGTTVTTPVTSTPINTTYILTKSTETLTGGAGNDTLSLKVSGTPAASWSATTVSCTALNQHLCLQAQFEKQVEFLASPVTGGAVVVSRFEQLYLLCIKQGKKLPAEWAAQV